MEHSTVPAAEMSAMEGRGKGMEGTTMERKWVAWYSSDIPQNSCCAAAAGSAIGCGTETRCLWRTCQPPRPPI